MTQTSSLFPGTHEVLSLLYILTLMIHTNLYNKQLPDMEQNNVSFRDCVRYAVELQKRFYNAFMEVDTSVQILTIA